MVKNWTMVSNKLLAQKGSVVRFPVGNVFATALQSYELFDEFANLPGQPLCRNETLSRKLVIEYPLKEATILRAQEHEFRILLGHFRLSHKS